MNNQPPIPAALAALLSDRCVLMSESHTRAMIARVKEGAAFEQQSMSRGEYVLDADARPAATRISQMTFGQPAAATQVAVIPVNGVLNKDCDWWGMCSTNRLLEQLAAALSDSQVSSIVLDIDSPGGFVSGTVELADAVYAANQVKPVTAVIRGLCCSGAYWLASQCKTIVSRPECEVGNIGVYSVLADVSAAYKAMGVDLTLIASGQFKGMGADGRVTDDLISDTRRINQGLFQQFVNAVAKGRGMDTEEVLTLADGRAFLGTQATKLGLVDTLASSFDAAIQAATGTGNATDPHSENAMSKANPAAANQTPPVATPVVAKKADDEEGKKSSDATRKMLSDTTATANAHRDQSRKALDHASELADDEEMDAETKSLANKCVAALGSANSEATRAAKAWQSKTGGKDDTKETPEDGGDDDDGDEAKSLAKFVALFGGEFGGKCFTDKKPLAAATAEYLTQLKAAHKTEVDKLTADNAELVKKLAAMPRGNDEALASFSPETQTGPAAGNANDGMNPNLARWKNAIKLPSKN